MKRPSSRKKPLTPAIQFFVLKQRNGGIGQGTLRRGQIVWEYEGQPTLLGRRYKLKLAFRQGGSPEVWVTDPDLPTLAEGRTIPHVYAQSPTKLCLYRPGKGQWAEHMFLAETIVPWSLLWLFYFEEWLLSDDWKGGGEHPTSIG